MIGQGKVLLSPLAAAIMAGSVGKGSPVSPQLVLNPDAGAAAADTAGGTTAEGGSPPSTVSPEAPAKASGQPSTPAEARRCPT